MKFCKDKMYEKIDDYINANRERIIKDLLTLVRIPSVQDKEEPGMPYGKSCDEMLVKTKEMYEAHGFKGKINHDGGYTVSYYGEDNLKTIGLFSHGDVVPVDDSWIVCPPFEPVIKDGYIFGRGCNDDKSGIIETIYAAEIIREMGFDLKSQLVMFTGVNEESGMGDIEAFVANEPMPDASLIADGEYPCYCGEKGIGRFSLLSKKRFDNIRNIYGGKAVNIVLGELICKISYNEKLEKQIKNLCDGNESFEVSVSSDIIRITAKGVSSHVIHADKALNACKLLSDMLLKCDALSENDRDILTKTNVLLTYVNGEAFGIEKKEGLFGGLVCGNGFIGVKEGRIELFFDMRAGQDYDMKSLSNQIEKSISEDWEYIESNFSDGYYTPEDSILRITVEETYKAVSGITDVKSINTAGGTHARKIKNALPIGTVGYYKAKPIELPEGHGGVHQPDEKINIDGLMEAIKILVCMIMEIDAM